MPNNIGVCELCNEPIREGEAMLDTLINGRVHWECYQDD